MAERNIVKIDEQKCDGCGLCVNACAEGAIEIIDGKAKLVSEIYCDGLGACLGHCPQDAITIEKRQAEEFDEEATNKYLAQKTPDKEQNGFVCPGLGAKTFETKPVRGNADSLKDVPSQLSHWPVQLKLISPLSPFLKGADLLLTADCVPFAMADFHGKFLAGKSVAIACPKLDDTDDYIQKLADIFKNAGLKSLAIIHMEVPCCSGLIRIVQQAIALSGKKLSFDDITISLQGEVASTEKIN